MLGVPYPVFTRAPLVPKAEHQLSISRLPTKGAHVWILDMAPLTCFRWFFSSLRKDRFSVGFCPKKCTWIFDEQAGV